MGTAVDRLLGIAGPAQAGELRDDAGARPLPEGLRALLRARNGFLAFESALRVFPYGPARGQRSLAEWNAPDLWRDAFDGMSDGLLCFAEDAFGVQFALRDDAVVTFDPETGAADVLASSVEGWAAALLDDHRALTGWPLAREWQLRNGALPLTHRLVPTIPFVLGGDFAVGNLHALDAVEGMRLRGDIAVQLRDLPDGATVSFSVEGGADGR